MSPLRLDQVVDGRQRHAPHAGASAFSPGDESLEPSLVLFAQPNAEGLVRSRAVGGVKGVSDLHCGQGEKAFGIGSGGNGDVFFDVSHGDLAVSCGTTLPKATSAMHTSAKRAVLCGLGAGVLPLATDALPMNRSIGSSCSPELARVTATAPNATDRFIRGTINREYCMDIQRRGEGERYPPYLIKDLIGSIGSTPGKSPANPRPRAFELLPMPIGSTGTLIWRNLQ